MQVMLLLLMVLMLLVLLVLLLLLVSSRRLLLGVQLPPRRCPVRPSGVGAGSRCAHRRRVPGSSGAALPLRGVSCRGDSDNMYSKLTVSVTACRLPSRLCALRGGLQPCATAQQTGLWLVQRSRTTLIITRLAGRLFVTLSLDICQRCVRCNCLTQLIPTSTIP